MTVSGLPLSGKTTIARKLCERLELEYFSPGGLRNELVANKGVAIRDYEHASMDGENGLVDSRQVYLMKRGGVVVDGIYAAALCYVHNIDGFHIFLQAPPDVRAMRGRMTSEGVLELEEREARMGKKSYGQDYRNPHFYDMIIDTGKMAPSKVLKAVRAHRHVRYKLPLVPEMEA